MNKNRIMKLAGILNESLNEAPAAGGSLKKVSNIFSDFESSFDALLSKQEYYRREIDTVWKSIIGNLKLQGKTIGSVPVFEKGKGSTVNAPEIDGAKILSVDNTSVALSVISRNSTNTLNRDFEVIARCQATLSVELPNGKKLTLTAIYRPGSDKITIGRREPQY